MARRALVSRRGWHRRFRVVDHILDDGHLRADFVEILLHLLMARVRDSGEILLRLSELRGDLRDGLLVLAVGLLQLIDLFGHGRETIQNVIAFLGLYGVEMVQSEVVFLNDLFDVDNALFESRVSQISLDLIELFRGECVGILGIV